VNDPGIFDEPSISRQWVLRRLQQVLTTDLAAAAFERGLGRSCSRPNSDLLVELAAAAAHRAEIVRALILGEGGTPYQSIGFARAASYFGGLVLGPFSLVWRPGVRMLAEHTMQEYDTLVAHLRTAPGVSPDLAPQAEPLFASAERGHEVLRAR